MTRNSGSDPGRFALGTRPRAGESLPGYILRLAARVGMDARRLAGMAGLRQPGCATSTSDLGRLAILANLSAADLEHLAYRPGGRFAHHRLLAGTVHREMLDISARRACPTCLEEHGHHRAAWDLALLTSCPEHGIRLASRCPICDRKPGWFDPSVVACRCGSDLRQWPMVRATDGEAEASGCLLALAAGGDVGWLPSALRACDPSDLVRLAMCLGMFRTGWARDRRVETLCAAGADVVAHVVIRGVGGLAEWPFPLLEFLAGERAGAAGRPGRFGARKALGSFYAWLRDIEAEPVQEALLTVVRDSIKADPILAQRMHRSDLIAGAMTERQADAGEVVGLVRAATLLGRSQASVKRLLADGALPGGASEGRGIPVAINQAAVQELARREAGEMTLEQATAFLGVSKARTRRIVEFALPDGGRRASAGQWAIRVESLRALLTDLEGHALQGSQPTGTVGFDHAAEALRRRGVDVAAMVIMIREGRLRPACVDIGATGLKRLRFDQHAVRIVCRGLERGQLLTVQVAAERLGLKWEVAAHLISQGLLHTSEDGGVAAEEVERFAGAFVSGAELARVRRTSPRALAAMLAAHGVMPVSGPGVDGGRQNFFYRADLTRAGVASNSCDVQSQAATSFLEA